MSDWLKSDARKAVRDLVQAIEQKTSAEVVVTVRARSGDYRHAELTLGSLLALAALLVYVYFPITFKDDIAPPAIAVCFGAGVALAATLDGLKRLFLLRSTGRAQVMLAARAAFVDQRIASTRGRSGLLVYISLLEREVEVVPDIGVATADMGVAWTEAVARLETVIRGGGSVDAFGGAMKALGEVLAEHMPVAKDDINELPDEVVA